jgi:protocatechuate 3,4-dioxygenase beta subunit
VCRDRQLDGAAVAVRADRRTFLRRSPPTAHCLIALFAFVAAASPVVAQTTATAPSRTIRGQVVDASNGAPLRRARISVSSGEPVTNPLFTDDEGRFAIAMPAGAATLRASKAGYAPALASVAGNARAGAELRFVLTRSAAVMGRVVDSYGAPFSRAHVIGRLLTASGDGLPPAAGQFHTETDRFGQYRLGGVPAGRYEITAVLVPPELREPGTRVEDQLFGPREKLDVADRVASLTLSAGAEVDNVDFIIAGAAHDCPGGPSVRFPEGVPPTGIRGRVTDAAGAPLPCAQVIVRVPQGAVPGVYTDRQGRYTIEGLSAGSFILEARATGYIALQHGQRRPSDAELPIAVRDGEMHADADFALPSESIVSGTVADEHGEPVEGVPIWAFQIHVADGRPAIVSTVIARPTTDDRGQYRLIGVQPGAYLVAVMARGMVSAAADAGRGYAATYYPGTPDVAAAQRVAIDIGRDAQGIDITFAPRSVVAISGTVADAAGRPFAGTVSISPSARSGAVSLAAPAVMTAADGAFVIRNVATGDYVLKATGPESPLFGMQFVTVADADPPPVHIAVSAGATIEGRVIIDADRDANLAGLAVSVVSADTDYTQPGRRSEMFAREPDGTFRVTGARGPSRLAITDMPGCADCYLKSAYVNGMDAADTPFNFGLESRVYRGAEIVLSDGGAAIEGRVHNERDAPVATFAVVVIPAHRDLWYAGSRHLKIVRSTAGATFRAAGLPPGDYLVAAVSRFDPFSLSGQMIDPALLEELSAGATRVTLVERERRTVDLRLIRR